MTSTIHSLNTTSRTLLMTALLALASPVNAADPADATPTPNTNVVAEVSAAEGTNANGGWPWDEASLKVEKKESLIIKVMGLTIGLVATVMGVGIPLLAIWADYRKRSDLIEACHKERLAALEKGLEVPPFPMEATGGDYGLHPKPEPPKDASPMSGVMWMLVGIGLLIWLSFSPKSLFHPSFAAIPIAIGVAYLISFLYERRAKQR